ncbi:MAG TPA: ABC transporter ATP-binding protein [Planctomycetota bacterium]|nr:ABC transporter ATP-binding protein [Planctomycetota bacterium]
MAEGGDALVRIDEVGMTYVRGSEPVRVLDRLSLDIREGDYFALMGPSGSGKSTLLNLIGGLDRPTDGSIRVEGVDLGSLGDADLADWRARHVGFIFQSYNLIPVLTAFQNVELPLLLQPELSRRQRKEQVDRVLGLVGLSERSRHYPNQLSGGQEQRVAIARAIATDPTLLLADEPTGDLDHDNAEAILDLLDTLNRKLGKTIIMVTHDEKAARRAHRVLRLEKGGIVADRAGAAAR